MRLILFFLGGFLLANLVVAGTTVIRAPGERPREFNISQKRSLDHAVPNEPAAKP